LVWFFFRSCLPGPVTPISGPFNKRSRVLCYFPLVSPLHQRRVGFPPSIHSLSPCPSTSDAQHSRGRVKLERLHSLFSWAWRRVPPYNDLFPPSFFLTTCLSERSNLAPSRCLSSAGYCLAACQFFHRSAASSMTKFPLTSLVNS